MDNLEFFKFHSDVSFFLFNFLQCLFHCEVSWVVVVTLDVFLTIAKRSSSSLSSRTL